jgi:hypothetical protein
MGLHLDKRFRGRWWFRTTDLRLVRARKATLQPAEIRKTPRQTEKTIRCVAHPFAPVCTPSVARMWHEVANGRASSGRLASMSEGD